MGLGIFAINEIFNAWYINGAKIFHQYDLVVVNITRFWGFLDLTLQDVDGFLFFFALTSQLAAATHISRGLSAAGWPLQVFAASAATLGPFRGC